MPLRFGVYEHRLVYGGDRLLIKHFIVLRDEYGLIQRWTDFDKYAQGGRKMIARNLFSTDEKRCKTACKLLNYVFFDKYHITKLVDLEIDMVVNFLKDYGLCRLPDDNENTVRSKSTVISCVNEVRDFVLSLIEDGSCKIREQDLYREERVFNQKKRKYVMKRVPVFQVYYIENEKKILRDLPEGAFQIIMNEVMANHRNILMLFALGAFAGLRPSEACNVRRVDSKLGPGIMFDIVNGDVVGVTIDLKQERPLRSDLVNVGGIKKPRYQKVYPAFLDAFMECYNMYMKYIKGRPYEEDYGALTTTSTGMAYTYDAYSKEFKNAVNDAIPAMLASDDPETVNYGHLLQQYSISPHILRHWYSVKLALYGETVAGLMNWRGDKSPESALTYLMNKSELEKQLAEVNREGISYMLWRAEKEHNDD